LIWVFGYTANGFDVAIGVALGLGYAIGIRALADVIRTVTKGYIPSGPTWTEQDDRLYEIVNRRIQECSGDGAQSPEPRSHEEKRATRPGPSVRIQVTEQVTKRGSE